MPSAGAYNPPMARPNLLPLRAAALALTCVAFIGVSHAQTAPASPGAPAAGAPAEDAAQRQDALRGRKDQKIERIHIEDSRTNVDELRYGGQTQNITVTPKGGRLPEYEVTPQGNSRSPSVDNQDPSASGHGPSKWNVLKF